MTIEDEIKEICTQHTSYIYVREKIDGRWGSYSLAELPWELRERWIRRFCERKIFPVRIKTGQ